MAWKLSYKKLKVKIRGEKVVEPPKKQLKYHYSSASEESKSIGVVLDDTVTTKTNNDLVSALIKVKNS